MGLLRLLLALSVVLNHTEPIFGFSLTGGKVSVQAFYIISGFYMSMILNEKYIGNNNSYWLFLSNRLMRLFPVYWCVLLLTILFSVLVGTFYNHFPVIDVYSEYFHQMNFGSFAYLVLTNIFLFGQDLIMYMGLDTLSGELFYTNNFRETQPPLYHFLFIPQAWTIGIELTFYLIAPLLMRRKPWVIVSLILASLVLRMFLYQLGFNNDPWTYRFFPTELAFFLAGNLSYLLYKDIKKVEIKIIHTSAAFVLMISFTLAYGFLPNWMDAHSLFTPFSIKECLYFSCFFLLLPFIFQLTKKWRLDSYIGELSYPVYISHFLILMAVKPFYLKVNLGLGLAVTLGTLALSIGLNEVIAKKVEVLRQRRVKTSISSQKATSLH